MPRNTSSALGAKETVSIDASAYEGASLVHDMNAPIGDELKRKFSTVIDGGTLEHVFNFPVAIKNCMQMLDVGGHFFAHTMANNFMGHGFYQFSPELFYRVFSPENGFLACTASWCSSSASAGRDGTRRPTRTSINERVELINGRPTYLFVHAERVADVPMFAAAPQQADYAAHWSRNAKPQLWGAQGLRGRVHRSAKAHNDFFLRLFAGTALRLGAGRCWCAACRNAAFAAANSRRCERCGPRL